MRVVVATGGDIGTHVTRPQGPDQLTPELVGAKAQAQHGDAQDAVVRQRHLVLPEGIVDGCESLRVLNAVNLHDERVVLPPGVEIDAAVGQRADDLPFGGCDANAPTERAQVELAEGWAPSHTSRTMWSSVARRGRSTALAARVCHCSSKRAGVVSRCWMTRHRMSAASRSLRDHPQAWMAATSGRTRGTPALSAGGIAERRCSRVPLTWRRRLFRGNDTSI